MFNVPPSPPGTPGTNTDTYRTGRLHPPRQRALWLPPPAGHQSLIITIPTFYFLAAALFDLVCLYLCRQFACLLIPSLNLIFIRSTLVPPPPYLSPISPACEPVSLTSHGQ